MANAKRKGKIAPSNLFLNRILMESPYYALCTTEEQYVELMEYLEIPTHERWVWVNKNAHATTHTVRQDGKLIMIVCVAPPEPHRSGIDIASLLVHEAVHVWQQLTEDIGESNPSPEFEAYSIQTISSNLMHAYVSLTSQR